MSGATRAEGEDRMTETGAKVEPTGVVGTGSAKPVEDPSQSSGPMSTTTDRIQPPTQPSSNHLSTSPSTSTSASSAMGESTTAKNLSRRSSQFHSSRPAPPSPAPSRRASQIHSPALSSRDRASSTSSSAGHMSATASQSGASGFGTGSASGLARKLSQSQGASLSSRNSISKNRPRSSLGTAMYNGEGSEDVHPVPLLFGEKEKDKVKDRSRLSHSAPSPNRTPSIDRGLESPAKSATAGSHASTPSTAFSTTNEDNQSSTPVSSSISPTNNVSPAKTPSRKPSAGAVIIRDYGFPSSDERFHGRGQPIPPAESSSSARLSSFLASSASPSERRGSAASESKREKEKGWSFSMLSWRGFIGRSSRSNSRSEAGGAPGVGGTGPLDQSQRSADADSEPDLLHTGVEGAEDDYAFESSSEDDEEPFGLYRAAYPFEAEGEHEISLEDGEVVEVKGRGGGEGWVIAVKLKKKGSATEAGTGSGSEGPKDMIEGLVPEGYLEKVDEEELRSGMIHAGFQGGQRHPVAPGGISEEPEETSDLETGAGH